MKQVVNSTIIIFLLLFVIFEVFQIKVYADEGYLWPVPNTRTITQYFGNGHEGIDIAAGGDNEIVAARSGTIVAAQSNTCPPSHGRDNCNYGMGNYVQIQQDDGRYSTYMHMRYGSLTVTKGQYIRQGDKIGMMGSSGNSTGQHLHYQLTVTANKVLVNTNPDSLNYKYEIAPSDPTPPIITEAKVERPSDKGGQFARIRVKANDNESGVAGVLCRIFKPEAGEQDFTDNEASLVGDEWIYDFSSADYGGMQGKYRLHIYAYNNVPESGNYSDIRAYELWVESTPPNISGFQIVDIDQNGFAVMGNCSDDTSGIDRVEIYAWEEGKKENETIRSVYPNEQNQINAWIPYSDFASIGRPYNTHVYIFDRAGNYQVTTMVGSQEYRPVKSVSQNGHRYTLYNQSGSYELAQRMAETMGGHLVTINDESEQQLVESLIKDGGQYFYWLGGYTEDHQSWKWQTGEPFNYSNWGQGEPNNSGNVEDKMAIYTHSGTWNDMGASQRTDNGFIIEYEPLRPNAAAKSITHGGKKYTRYDVGVPYTEAEQYCADLGGKLAAIPNQETNNSIKDLMTDGKSQYWLGGNNIEKNGHWAWNKSDIMQYSNWAQNEPNNGNGGIAEHYLSIYSDGTWNDMPSFTYTLNTQMGFICETNIPIVTPIKLGDVDGDGNINASDGLTALRHSVKEIALKGDPFTKADVTKDKVVNAADALQILRYSVKEIIQF